MATGRRHQRLTPGPALGVLLLWGNVLQMHGGVRPPLMCLRLTPLAAFPNCSSPHATTAFILKLPSVLLLLPLPAPRGNVWSYQVSGVWCVVWCGVVCWLSREPRKSCLSWCYGWQVCDRRPFQSSTSTSAAKDF